MIKVQNVVLRKLEEKDLDQLYKFRNDLEIKSSLGGFSSGYSRADLKRWLDVHEKCQNEILWAIAAENNDACIGHVGFYNIDFRSRKAEFAILIGEKNYHGKGLGSSVTKEIIRYGFQELNLHKVYLTVLENNIKAIGLYKALGFHQDGILIDEVFRNNHYQNMLLMSLLEHEYVYS